MSRRPAELDIRLRGPRASSSPWGWAALVLVTVIGGALRFWRLNRPHVLVFDETYYVKQGASLLKSGYELRWDPDRKNPSVDELFAAGHTDVFLHQPDFVVHPPLGKWMIAAGEWVTGPSSSWGWRLAPAVCGTLSIFMIGLIARRLFGSALLGVVAALLLAVDGQHFVHSRTGLLDIFVMFWALAAFGFLLLDRDSGHRRLAARIDEQGRAEQGADPPGGTAAVSGGVGALGPFLGVRWWRLAAFVCLGLDCGIKWSGLYFAVAFAVLAFAWDAGARRAAGVRHWALGALCLDVLPWGLAWVVILPVTYLATWTGWFLSSGAQYRNWATENPSRHFGWVPDALRSLWYYHQQMYTFHVNLHDKHVYQSNPWSWTVLGRPTAFYYYGPHRGNGGCAVEVCSKAVTALGNPVVWWGGTLAIGVLLFRWALSRDWRAGAILAGLVGGWLPWFSYQERTIFTFYAVAFVPWIVLGLTYALGLLLGPSIATGQRRLAGTVAVGSVVLLAVLAFWFFLPIYTAQVIPQSSWSARMWLPSWI